MPGLNDQHRRFQHGMDVHENRFRQLARRAINGNLRNAARLYAERGEVPGFLKRAHEDRWYEALSGHYRATIRHFGLLALSGIRRQKAERKATLVESLIAEFIAREALRRAKLIADTDFDAITAAIAAGVGEGEGTDAIARRIRKVSAETPFRAALIARTETHMAATYGGITSAREAEDELGVRLLKRWSPTLDARTRPAHLAMAGKPAIPLDEKFLVGGEPMDRPGDPSASGANLINCRCSLLITEAE